MTGAAVAPEAMKGSGGRRAAIDQVRGAAFLLMVAYHAAWDADFLGLHETLLGVHVGESLPRAVGRSIYLEQSARMQLQAMIIAGPRGKIAYLDKKEVQASVPAQNYARAWRMWRAKALASLKSEG